MIVHGWIDNLFLSTWMVEMKDALLQHGDYNVIIVDWTGGNGLPYTQAVANSRVVGAEMALLVTKLQVTVQEQPNGFSFFAEEFGCLIM